MGSFIRALWYSWTSPNGTAHQLGVEQSDNVFWYVLIGIVVVGLIFKAIKGNDKK